MADIIEVSQLHVVFGHGHHKVHAVRGVSFSVAKGECFGIVGESGSGKTTVLRSLCGLNTHWQGEVVIDGRPAPRHPDRAFYRTVQIVFTIGVERCQQLLESLGRERPLLVRIHRQSPCSTQAAQ